MDPKPIYETKTVTRTLKTSMAFGVPYGGATMPKFWGNGMAMAANMWRIGIEFWGVLHAGSMMVDGNRNNIVEGFLETKAEWLMWIDTDNFFKLGAIERLLNMNKTIATGWYVGKAAPYHSIAFRRLENGRYKSINKFEDYYSGEIIPIDMAGMGFCLTHRSVFEDMRDQIEVFQTDAGEYWPVHKSKVKSMPKEQYARHAWDGEVRKGQMRVRLWEPDHEVEFFPWFQMRYGKTEDVVFFENAALCGHKPWLDTSLEAKHFGPHDFTSEWQEVEIKKHRARQEKKRNVFRHPRDYEVNYDENPA